MARLKTIALTLLTAGIAVILTVSAVYFYHVWQHWLAVRTGSLNTSGTPPNYNYWSGFGAVFPWEAGMLAAVWAWVYQHSKHANCHTHGCWRLGSYPVEDYKVCKKCHYKVKGTHPTIEHLREVHNGSRPGSDQGGASEPDSGQCAAVIVNVGGVREPGQSPDASGVPEASGG